MESDWALANTVVQIKFTKENVMVLMNWCNLMALSFKVSRASMMHQSLFLSNPPEMTVHDSMNMIDKESISETLDSTSKFHNLAVCHNLTNGK